MICLEGARMTQTLNPTNPLESSNMAIASVTNIHVRQWISRCIEMCKPESIYLCDGSESQRQELLARAVAENVLIELNQQKLPELLSAPLQPQRRRPHRASARSSARPAQDMAGPTNNWMNDKAGVRQAARAVRRLHARADDVRRPVRHGPDRLAAGEGRRAADRFALRRRLMGIMTRMGDVAWQQLGDCRRVHPLPAQPRRCAIPTAGTSATSRSTTRSGASAPATAATRCWARSAWRCASPASWAGSRAGWPSTCCSWARTHPTARRPTSPPRFPAPAARPTSRC